MRRMESTGIIKNAGLKITPQRKVVYEVMMELRHAAIDEIIKSVQSKDNEITISTIYRILDSFCKANLLSLVFHPEVGISYYDITVTEHHHIFEGESILDYMDEGLTELIRQYLKEKRRTRQTLWSAVQMLTQKLCCQTIHDCPKVVPLHYESE